MKTIHKYELPIGPFTLELPTGAEFLSVQAQAGLAQSWWLVETGASTSRRAFVVYGTGHEVRDEPRRFLGTFQLQGGAFVGHLFEVPLS